VGLRRATSQRGVDEIAGGLIARAYGFGGTGVLTRTNLTNLGNLFQARLLNKICLTTRRNFFSHMGSLKKVTEVSEVTIPAPAGLPRSRVPARHRQARKRVY
jgi:hypothetical protein